LKGSWRSKGAFLSARRMLRSGKKNDRRLTTPLESWDACRTALPQNCRAQTRLVEGSCIWHGCASSPAFRTTFDSVRKNTAKTIARTPSRVAGLDRRPTPVPVSAAVHSASLGEWPAFSTHTKVSIAVAPARLGLSVCPRLLIHTVVATSANVADAAVTPDLLHGEETRVWGDGAYQGKRR